MTADEVMALTDSRRADTRMRYSDTPKMLHDRSDDPARARRLLRHRRPSAAEAAGRRRIIVWTIVNLEVWDIAQPMARQVLPAPTGQSAAARRAELVAGTNTACASASGASSISTSGSASRRRCRSTRASARTIRASRSRPRTPAGSSWAMPMSRGRSTRSEDQRGMINRSMDVIEKFTGKRPVGWLGPGLTQTLETPEYLAEAGVKYIGDWVYDDEPTVIRTAKGPLVTLPYTVELNDIPMMIVQHHESDHLHQARHRQLRPALRGKRASAPKIMALAIHPYISGQPFRIKYLEADLRLRQQLRRRAALERRARSSTGITARYPSWEQRRERHRTVRPTSDCRDRSAGRGRRLLSRPPGLLRRPQLSRPYPRDEGSRRARSAVLLPEAARCCRA